MQKCRDSIGSRVLRSVRRILTLILNCRTRLRGWDEKACFSSSLDAKIDFELEECSNKAVILVDDVLNSGKSLAYGFGVFLDAPLKKLRTVVLVDRNHKSFPVNTDYAGIALSTIIKEHIDVVLDEEGQEDAIYLRW